MFHGAVVAIVYLVSSARDRVRLCDPLWQLAEIRLAWARAPKSPGLTTPSYVSTNPLPYPGRTPGVARRGVRAPKDWGGRVLHQSEKCSQWTNVRAVWRR